MPLFDFGGDPFDPNAGQGRPSLFAPITQAVQAARAPAQRESVQQWAVQRLESIDTPQARSLAKMAREQPRALAMVMQQYGGMDQLEQGLQAQAKRKKAGEILQQYIGDLEPGQQPEAFGAFQAFAAGGEGMLEPALAAGGGLAEMAQLQARAAGEGRPKPISPSDAYHNRRVATARRLWDQMKAGKSPEWLRNSIAREPTDLFNFGKDDPSERIMADLHRTAMLPLKGGVPDPDHDRYANELLEPPAPSAPAAPQIGEDDGPAWYDPRGWGSGSEPEQATQPTAEPIPMPPDDAPLVTGQAYFLPDGRVYRATGLPGNDELELLSPAPAGP